MQGATMAFVELREERSWTIQGVVIAHPTGNTVSRQMVKWVGGLQLESFVSDEGTFQKNPYADERLPGHQLRNPSYKSLA